MEVLAVNVTIQLRKLVIFQWATINTINSVDYQILRGIAEARLVTWWITKLMQMYDYGD